MDLKPMDLFAPGGAPATVAAVVCTHRIERLDQLRAALDSLVAQTRRLDEIVVVVDGDAALADAVAAGIPGFRVECVGINSGVSVARTLGAQKVSADAVFFLDDDATAEPAFVQRLLKPFSDGRVVAVSGRSIPDFVTPPPRWLPEEFWWTIGCSYRGMPESTTSVRNVYGGCAIIRRQQFLDLGGYTESLGHLGRYVGGGEEAEFGLRVGLVDPRALIVYQPSGAIHHRVPGDRLTLRYYWKRCHDEGVLKAQMSAMVSGAALDAERSFALKMPATAARYLVTGRVQAAFGILLGVLAVLSGLVRGRRMR